MSSPTIDDLSDAQKRVLVRMHEQYPDDDWCRVALDTREYRFSTLVNIEPLHSGTVRAMFRKGLLVHELSPSLTCQYFTLTPAGRELAEQIKKEMK